MKLEPANWLFRLFVALPSLALTFSVIAQEENQLFQGKQVPQPNDRLHDQRLCIA